MITQLLAVMLLFFTKLQTSLSIYVDGKLLVALIILPVSIFITNKKSNLNSNLKTPKNDLFVNIILALTLFTILLLFISPYTYTATRVAAMQWTSILVLLYTLLSKSSNIKLINTIFIISILSSTYAILEYFGYIELSYFQNFPVNVTGLIGHKNSFAFVIMVSFLWALSLILENPKKTYYYPIILLFVYSLGISNSRSSQLGAALGFVLILIPQFRVNPVFSSARNRTILLTSILLLSLMAFKSIDINTKNRIKDLITGTTKESLRSNLYSAEWNMFKDKPILGQGLGTVPHLWNHYLDAKFRSNYARQYTPMWGHNEYLQTLAEQGIIGFLLIFTIWFGAVFIAIKKLRGNWDFQTYTIIIILFTMFIHASMSVASKKIPCSLLLWGHLGLLLKNRPQTEQIMQNTFSKNKTLTLFATISILFFVQFSKLVISDSLFTKARVFSANSKGFYKVNPLAMNSIKASLKVFPQNPYAINSITTELMKPNLNDYSSSKIWIDKLEECGYGLFPIPYTRALNYYNNSMLDSANTAINIALKEYGKYLPAIKLKLLILKDFNDSNNFNNYSKVIAPYLLTNNSKKTLDYLDDEYKKIFGRTRTNLAGGYLYKYYITHYNRQIIAQEQNNQYKRSILKLVASN